MTGGAGPVRVCGRHRQRSRDRFSGNCENSSEFPDDTLNIYPISCVIRSASFGTTIGAFPNVGRIVDLSGACSLPVW